MKLKNLFKRKRERVKQEKQPTEKELNEMITGRLLLDQTVEDCNVILEDVTIDENAIHNYTNDSFAQIQSIIVIYGLLRGNVNITSFGKSIYQQNRNPQFRVLNPAIPIPNL